MARYDWVRGYDRGFGSRRTRGGYASDYGSWGDAWGSAGGDSGFWGRGVGLYRGWGTPWEGRGPGGGAGYDRGVYGGSYPQYGGHPGGGARGMYYGGGGAQGYDRGYRSGGSRGYDYGGGYGGGYGPGRGGYDRSFARAPFVPEEAYRRHPELGRQQAHHSGRWPDRGDEGAYGPLDDEEIRQGVRQSLYQDQWIDPDRMQVEVSDGVVTLTGEVDDFMQARYAWDDAWESAGVRGVINNLHVRVDQARDQHGDPLPQEE